MTTTLQLPASRVQDPNSAPPLRWGIMGPGRIATDFASSLKQHTQQQLTAVASRNHARAEDFAEQFGIGLTFDSYQALAASPDVDVVYIATPHPFHAECARIALEHGKHVLIEKPFAVNAEEAQSIVELARERNLFAMEAMWARFTPAADVIRQILANGLLGEVQHVRADLGEHFDPVRNARLFDPALGGGSLLDLGVYLIAYDAFLFGEPPLEVAAVGNRTDSGVSADVAMTLTHRTGTSQLFTTLDVRTPTAAFVKGSTAMLEIHTPFYAPTAISLRANDASSEVRQDFSVQSQVDGLCFEAAEVARCITAGLTESPHHTLDGTVETLRVLDRAESLIPAVGVALNSV
ncbi:Gfo/Idh/MocA family protein [Gulosibacter chungangensis]|uniref:Gfo/Idh/MocA family oxidoreductase n=1 Tax=Gulosibacter chungangensis TaxID=979746 RepID=A0A7J5BGA9_9MICO|nr:Gfo/Idh/MocA family oxidoreductase [Gulosibacter chungangensis]KAB1645295.1 Gfo/Idh/MocA family oxidoreductase [Gulosibacter chungangensis]